MEDKDRARVQNAGGSADVVANAMDVTAAAKDARTPGRETAPADAQKADEAEGEGKRPEGGKDEAPAPVDAEGFEDKSLAMGKEAAVLQSKAVVANEPSQREIFYNVLSLVEGEEDEKRLNEAVLALPQMRVHLRSPKFYLNELFDAGALRRHPLQAQVDPDAWADEAAGEKGPSAGSDPDAPAGHDADASAPAKADAADDADDAEGKSRYTMPRHYRWRLTDAGRQVLADTTPANRLRALFDKQSDVAQVYASILDFCKTPKSRQDVEKMVSDHKLAQGLGVMTSFFLDHLEQAGGLVWDGGWRTTSDGEVFAAKPSKQQRRVSTKSKGGRTWRRR